MICAIVLAAGRSVRMGTQKLLLPLGGKPLIAHIVDELLNAALPVFVVVSQDEKLIRIALGDRGATFVQNPDHESDMLGSVRCGLRALPAQCEAALLAVGDQPGLTRQLISELTRIRANTGKGIVAPEYNGKRGHPLLVSSQYFGEILQQYDGVGLHGLLKAHPEEVRCFPVSDPRTLHDMDTPEDYQRHLERIAK